MSKVNKNMGFDAYRDILFDKDSSLGNISESYLELLGQFLIGKKRGFETLFKYYKKQKFNIDVKDTKYLYQSERYEKYCLPFFVSFGELIQAFVEFEESLFYLQNYPSKYLGRIGMFEWGNYHLKVVNQQFYILKERIIKFVKTIEKIAKEDEDKRFIKLEGLQKVILIHFQPILDKRHEIVHEQAFLDEDLDCIFAMGSELKKTKKENRIVWEIVYGSDTDVKMKNKLAKKVTEISVELKNLLHFLNSNFDTVSEIIEDWYAAWETEYAVSK